VTHNSTVKRKFFIPSTKYVGKQFLFTFYLATYLQLCTEAISWLISKMYSNDKSCLKSNQRENTFAPTPLPAPKKPALEDRNFIFYKMFFLLIDMLQVIHKI